MPKELFSQAPAQVTPQVPRLGLSRLFLVIGLVSILSLGYLAWRNWRLKQQLDQNKLALSIKPVPTYTASRSAQLRYEPLPEANLNQPIATTKGGLVLSDSTNEEIVPTPTPTPTPTPIAATTKATAPSNPQVNWLTKVYFDAQFPYQIRFNDSWIFRRTHGTDTSSAGPTVLSRIDLSQKNGDNLIAYVSAEVLPANGYVNLETWLKTYEPQVSFADSEKISFRDLPAAKITQGSATLTQKLYFLKGAYAYRLTAWQQQALSPETLAIRDSFKP